MLVGMPQRGGWANGLRAKGPKCGIADHPFILILVTNLVFTNQPTSVHREPYARTASLLIISILIRNLMKAIKI